jgi:spore coat protein CotH
VKATAVNIKGRGNSTWGYDKKPYRLKFDKKISLCGMTKAKNYALIANYLDPSLMRNAVALKIAELLGMPYTNHCIPVNLTFNGNYRGSYMLTEKIGFNAASVNVKDESKAILFELDKNYDEPYKFTSTRYKLPVMVKDPDFDELAEADTTLTAEKRLEEWQADFTQMENGVRLKKFYDYIDISSAVDYMLVYLVTKNAELNHPKSVYMYKEKIDDKYTLGPVWDFDWAYTFSSTNKENASPTQYLLSYGSTLYGYSFFKAIVSTTEFKTAFAERWQYFKDEVWPAVQEYMAEYHDLIEVSALQNGEVWPEDKLLSYVASSEKFEEHYQNLLKFLTDRIAWIDTASNYGLYE